MLWFSLRVAGVATAAALAVGPWLAWLLARKQFAWKAALAALLGAALFVPPPVICYYFLCVLERRGSFTWQAAGAAAALASVPLMVWAGRAAFTRLDARYANAARTLGASEWRVFWVVELPLAYRPMLLAAGLAGGRVLAETLATLAIASRLKP
jgi:molybdate transport system permease protein